MMDKKEKVSFVFTLDKVVFKKDTFCIARVRSKSESVRKYLNPNWYNVSIKGQMPSLKGGVEYEATVTDVESNQYGYTLSVEGVYPKNFNTDTIISDDDMINFLEVFLSPSVADKVSEVEGICDIVKNGDVEALCKINGIGKKTANKIVDTYEEDVVGSKYIVKLKKLGFTDNEISKLKLVHGENLLISYNIIKENIFDLVFRGFQLGRMDNIFLNSLNGSPKDKKRIKAYMWKSLQSILYEDYRSYVDLDVFFRSDTMVNIKENIQASILDKCMSELIEEEKVTIIEGKYITVRNIYNYDKFLYRELSRLIDGDNISKEFKNVDIDKEIQEEQNRLGVELNEGQYEAVKSILKHNIVLLTGGGGCGKTFALKVALNILERNIPNYSDTLVALSGKASGVLSESTDRNASTIHRALGMTGEGCSYNEYNPLQSNVVVVDEVSMVSNDIMYKLLRAVENDSKIIFIGDQFQLQAIGFANFIADMSKIDKIKHVSLTKAMRQALDSGILSLCTDIRNDKNTFDKKENAVYGKLQDMEVNIGTTYFYEMIKDYAKNFDVNNKMDYVILACTKKLANKINVEVQKELIKIGKLNGKGRYIEIPSVEKKDNGKLIYNKVYEGQNIMIVKNDYKLLDVYDYYQGEKNGTKSLFNGNTCIVKEVFDDAVLVIDQNNEEVIIPQSKYSIIENGYSFSIHKSQGSTIKYCYMYLENNYVTKSMLLSNEALYTGISRAKKSMKMYVEDYSVLSSAIKNREINKRRTVLEMFIDGKIKL